MSETLAAPKRKETVEVVRGQLHKFMLIPIMPHHVVWIDAGPVSFGVEARALPNREGGVGERGASIHVFDAAHEEEYLRFDCFDGVPHYHYLRPWATPEECDNHEVDWDEVANGPMLPWVIERLRTRLPEMLTEAGADDLAATLDQAVLDRAVDRVEALVRVEQPVSS